MKQLLITTQAGLMAWSKNPKPAKFLGLQNVAIRLPETYFFSGSHESNEGCGLIFESCDGIRIQPFRVVQTDDEPLVNLPYRRGVGIALSKCRGVQFVGVAEFFGCHSGMMLCDGTRDVVIGSLDNTYEATDCWTILDVHARGCSNIQAWGLNGPRVHVGNTGKNLFATGCNNVTIGHSTVGVVEFAGPGEGHKLYQSAVKEVRLYHPMDGQRLSVRLEDLGDAIVEHTGLRVEDLE